MTISTTESSITYTGNGVTLAFAVPFRFLVNGDLAVVLRSTTGVETTQILSTNYSLTGAGDDAGGTLTMVVAPASGEKLVIRRVVAITQETDYITGDKFPAESHERALDRLTMIAQQQENILDRVIRLPATDTPAPELPTSPNRVDKLLSFDGDGEPVVTNFTATQVASAIAAAYLAGAVTTADAIAFLQEGVGAEPQTLQEYGRERFTITQFGASPSASAATNTLAINAAYAAATVLGGREVFWPDGVYNTDGTIYQGAANSTHAPQARLVYAGTGTAFVVDGIWDTANGVNKGSNDCIFPVIQKSSLVWFAGVDTTSIGLLIKDRKMSKFGIRGVSNFARGLVLESIAANTVCCTFDIGLILNNAIGIDFGTVNPGFGTNQNQFIGGQVTIDSAYAKAGTISVNMPNAGENNTNVFVGVNLEKGGQEKGVVCASPENIFIGCRFEGGLNAGYITVSGNRNKFIGGAPSAATSLPYETWITNTGSGNMFWMGTRLAGRSFALDFSSVSAPLLFGNGSSNPTVPIGGFGTDRLALGNSSTPAVRHHGMMQNESVPVTSGALLPQRSALVLTYGSATTITGMTLVGATDTSALVAITSTNGNATLEHAASPAANAGKFVNKAGANLLLTANTPVLYQLVGGNLYQV